MIREIKKDDEEQIKDLIKLFSKEVQKNLLIELNQAFLKIISGYVYFEKEVRGYIILRKWGGVYWLDTLAVNPKFQGQGIGSSLVDFAKEKCAKEKIPQLNTCTFEDKNISFYEKLRFIQMGNLEGVFIPLNKKRTYLKCSINF